MNIKTLGLASVICVAFLLCACGDGVLKTRRTPPPPVSKKIILKVAPTEQMMTYDLFDNQGLRSRAKTVYYLVAEDGTKVRVGLSDYAKAKEGEQWSAPSYSWSAAD